MSQPDVIVIGSGIGGLCCAGLLAYYGREVLVCESHSQPGGAAHSFQRGGYHFDSGPSLHSGLTRWPSSNPLQQVLHLLGESVPCATYTGWDCHVPEGQFRATVGADAFCDLLLKLRGAIAVQQWRELQRVMAPLGAAATAISPGAWRWDWLAPLTLARSGHHLLDHLGAFRQITAPFSRIVDEVISDAFLRHWLDLLCFLLSGFPASGTSTAEMAFMFADWYQPDVVLDYPLGGSGALIDALVRGVTKHGGEVRCNATVEEILIESGQAVGVRLRGGEEVRAKQAIASNASIWDTIRLIPDPNLQAKFTPPPACDSFLHLHLGFDGAGLDDLDCHGIVVADWDRGVTDPQNVVVFSMPSVLDPTLAPPGHHALHVYTPATEPFHLWADLERGSAAYDAMKQERLAPVWQAMERVIPDLRDRCAVTLEGTPLTHRHFLRRDRGSYGPAISAQTGIFPGCHTPIPKLLCCGDSTFPGIGVPAVAASGMITANTLVSVFDHLKLLNALDR
ncbi:phytoene desaturase family protein [Spirulina major]|uniref:phytoene desaturase family protein n=1 Tax=Spirulina major TaxID=270636 RepID=UPI000932D2EA|nr:NAD(P)/FAD-dependent oxidoreductase [Spirulina major]